MQGSDSQHHGAQSAPVCLIADDSMVIAKGLGRCAESRGWQACLVHNGQDALRALIERASAGLMWDAVFLDDQMPILSGHEAILQFRQWEAQAQAQAQLQHPKQTNVFFITGSGPDGGPVSGAQAGQTMAAPPGFVGVVDGVFIKPINMTQMAGFLDSLAAARRR
mmetsp:Transcript_22731/g.65514  ORF Transcript_22731/g.65514 Transcript_22731/m.65514 type:complete len:165 (-) Transcript_22731:1779-2273(-)